MADSSSLLTRCPNCSTRFRVTDEQLNIANGKVRCGHCMAVFDARAQATDEEPATAASGQEHFSATDPHDDLVFEDNPEEDAAEGRYAGQSLSFSEDELSDSFRDAGTSAEHHDAVDEEAEQVDESWAEAMLHDDRSPVTAPERPTSDPEPEPASSASYPETNRDQASAAATPANESVTPSHSAAPQPATQALDMADDLATEPPIREQPTAADGFPPMDDLSPYRELSREPVAINPGRRSLRGWLWSLTIVALLAALVSQVAWFQFDRLSAIPELRPWYEKACSYAGCELDPLVALDRIQSRKLVVRTDPDNRDALLVDAVIINQAEFEQPFPSIALTFSNLNGDVVAQSIFPPQDYLAGDGAGMPAMPPGTPVRIAIGIRDPGRDAVNYNLRFVNRSSDR